MYGIVGLSLHSTTLSLFGFERVSSRERGRLGSEALAIPKKPSRICHAIRQYGKRKILDNSVS
jgi:hypothetical protein